MVLARSVRLLFDSRLGLGFLRSFLTGLLFPGGLLRRHQRRQNRRPRTRCRTRQIARRSLHRRTRGFYRRGRVHRRTLTSSTAAFAATVSTTRTVAAIPAIATAPVAQVA